MARKHIKLTGQQSQEVTGTVNTVVPPSTAFTAKTIAVTDTPQQLDSGAISAPTSVEVKSLSESVANILLGTTASSVTSATGLGDFRTLEPGEAVTLPLEAAVWVSLITGETDTAKLTYTFVN